MTYPTTPDPHPWYRVAMVDAQGGRFFAGFAKASTGADAVSIMERRYRTGGHGFTFAITHTFEPLTDHWHTLERNA